MSTSAAANHRTRCWAGCSPTSPPMPCGRRGAHYVAGDRSVQVHSCHGPARQVDVLREVLLGLLADDPHAGAPRHPGDVPRHRDLRPVDRRGLRPRRRGTGRAIRRTGCGCGWPTARWSKPIRCSAWPPAAHAGRQPGHRQRGAQPRPGRAGAGPFGFTDDDLEAITGWVRQANIRWGFDQEHRAPFGVDFIHNTWRFGIDRVLAGVAMSDDSRAWLGATLPLDDVGSNRVELAGRLAEFVARLQRTVDSLTGVRPLREWLTALDGRCRPADADHRRRRLADQPTAAGVRRCADAQPDRGRRRRAAATRHLARCWAGIWPAGRREPTSAPAR